MIIIRFFNKMTKNVKKHYSTKVAPVVENIKVKPEINFPLFLKKKDKTYQRQGNFFEGEQLIYAYYEVDMNDITDVENFIL